MSLADRKESIIVEIKDDTKDNMYGAAGLSIYSNNKSIVSSYLAIFDFLWKQSRHLRDLQHRYRIFSNWSSSSSSSLQIVDNQILKWTRGLSALVVEIEGYLTVSCVEGTDIWKLF